MAFAALYYPRDNDHSQLSLWPDNDDLTFVGDNLCDQYITFDSDEAAPLDGEAFNDPPSPSILLESFQKELNNTSSCPVNPPRDDFHPEAPTTVINEPIPIEPVATSADQVNPDSAVHKALIGDPILSTGSISDSELLRLEGISIKSSPQRGNVTAPSSPRKHSRLIGSAFATMRRVIQRPRPVIMQEKFKPIDTADRDLLNESSPGLDLFHSKYDEFADPAVPMRHEPMECRGLPITPPLTGRIPHVRRHNPSGFVSGYLDDPFCDDTLDTQVAVQSIRREGMTTPLSTPVGRGKTFSPSQAVAPLHSNTDSIHPPQKGYRTSSAKWPMEGYLTELRYNEDANLWPSSTPSATYVADNGHNDLTSPNWWDISQPGEMLHVELPHHSHHQHHRHATTTSGGNDVLSHNAAHNLSMHNQQAEMPYEYNAELTGLMIHMSTLR